MHTPNVSYPKKVCSGYPSYLIPTFEIGCDAMLADDNSLVVSSDISYKNNPFSRNDGNRNIEYV